VLFLGALLCSCSKYCCRLAAAALSVTQEWYGLGYGSAVTVWPYKTVANIRLQSAEGPGCQNSLENGNNFTIPRESTQRYQRRLFQEQAYVWSPFVAFSVTNLVETRLLCPNPQLKGINC
jgi:hypothetical protein